MQSFKSYLIWFVAAWLFLNLSTFTTIKYRNPVHGFVWQQNYTSLQYDIMFFKYVFFSLKISPRHYDIRTKFYLQQ